MPQHAPENDAPVQAEGQSPVRCVRVNGANVHDAQNSKVLRVPPETFHLLASSRTTQQVKEARAKWRRGTARTASTRLPTSRDPTSQFHLPAGSQVSYKVRRTLFTEDHEQFRQTVTAFFRAEVSAHLSEWKDAGRIDRGFFERAGKLGIMGLQAPEEYGGGGLETFTYNVVVSESAAAINFVPTAIRVHADIVLPYFLRYCNDDQRARWLPGLASGAKVAAIAMSEPGTGSDLGGIRTRAVLEGDHYVLNGNKAFITSGITASLIIVVARTADRANRRSGLSLLVLEDSMPGFTRGRSLDKLGLKYSDTVELFFNDVDVPVVNRIGEEGEAFNYLMNNLPQERISISVGAVSMAKAALDATVTYAKERELFGTTLGSFQNTKFVLAELATEIEAAQHLLDKAIRELDDGELSGSDAAKVKLFCTEVQGRTVDRCLQLFGGYGYTRDYPISDMFVDARVTRIYGGSSEVMKIIIARSLGT